MDIFNRTLIYNTIFLNVQSVTEYPDTKTFEDTEPDKFNVWLEMAKKRYTDEFAELKNDSELQKLISVKGYSVKEVDAVINGKIWMGAPDRIPNTLSGAGIV